MYLHLQQFLDWMVAICSMVLMGNYVKQSIRGKQADNKAYSVAGMDLVQTRENHITNTQRCFSWEL
jgi:hypothetical protein